MPYYFASTIEGWARTCFEDPIREEELRNSDIVFFVDDIVSWMDTRYGEEGDCECERNPRSNKKSYEKFPPKPTDQTKIGKWLRNYMEYTETNEDEIEENIFETIYDNINVRNIEKLFHSLEIDDQREFCNYISSDERFSENSEIDDTIEPYDSYDSDEYDSDNSDEYDSDNSDEYDSDNSIDYDSDNN